MPFYQPQKRESKTSGFTPPVSTLKDCVIVINNLRYYGRRFQIDLFVETEDITSVDDYQNKVEVPTLLSGTLQANIIYNVFENDFRDTLLRVGSFYSVHINVGARNFFNRYKGLLLSTSDDFQFTPALLQSISIIGIREEVINYELTFKLTGIGYNSYPRAFSQDQENEILNPTTSRIIYNPKRVTSEVTKVTPS